MSSPTDTLENTPHPDAAEAANQSIEQGHEQADHDHDHDEHGHGQEPEHDHQHGPVLNPDCTRELVLDIAAEEVSKAYGKVVGNYKKHAKIPGFRAGKVPDSVVKRRYAGEIPVSYTHLGGFEQDGEARAGKSNPLFRNLFGVIGVGSGQIIGAEVRANRRNIRLSLIHI